MTRFEFIRNYELHGGNMRDNGKVIAPHEAVHLMNELYEENERLKYSLAVYSVDLNNYKGKCSALEEENKELRRSPRVDVNEIESLVCENEHLKSENRRLKGWIKKEYPKLSKRLFKEL